METPTHDHSDGEPTLTELLVEEMLTQADASQQTGTYMTTDELPATITKLLTSSTFDEPVSEEVDWLISHETLLPATARRRLLAGVDRALRLRCADVKIRQASEDLFTDVPDDFASLAAELRDLLSEVEHGRVTAREFVPAKVDTLVRTAGIDPAIAFAAFRRSIRCAQGIRSDRVLVLASRSFNDEWDAQLWALRRLLLHEPGSDPPPWPSR
jgi:hypothetical protein